MSCLLMTHFGHVDVGTLVHLDQRATKLFRHFREKMNVALTPRLGRELDHEYG